MAENTRNSKRIAQNTIILYIRMVIVVLVGLYTSRVVLQALGIEDFGLYNVVGGVVALFTFLRTSMEKCTQRFLNVEMAKADGKPNETFCVSLSIHIGIAILAFILAETIGLWFLNTHIQIPDGREFAANCVFQSVVGGLVLLILTIPYSATIISHERMGVFAFISIVDCVLNLFIAALLLYVNTDSLVLYGALVLLVNITNFLMYVVYCRRKFTETKYKFIYDKARYQEMLGYTSWTLLGHAMILGTNQGNIILVNMFHGVAANAAMAVANQVNRQVLNLTSNFQTAFNPQITKAYASNDFEYMQKLVYATSKISYFLLVTVSIPLIFNIDTILDIWLDEVPQYSGVFCILMLSSGILQATSAPLNFAVMATGRIKWFQIVTGLTFISDLFILYALFSMGLPPTTAMWVKLSIMAIVIWVRLFFAQKEINSITAGSYLLNVIVPIICSTAVSVLIAFLLKSLSNNLLMDIIMAFFMVIICCISAYIIGLTRTEKQLVRNFIKKRKK